MTTGNPTRVDARMPPILQAFPELRANSASHQAKRRPNNLTLPYLPPAKSGGGKSFKNIWLMLQSFIPNGKNHSFLHVLYYYRYIHYYTHLNSQTYFCWPAHCKNKQNKNPYSLRTRKEQ